MLNNEGGTPLLRFVGSRATSAQILALVSVGEVFLPVHLITMTFNMGRVPSEAEDLGPASFDMEALG